MKILKILKMITGGIGSTTKTFSNTMKGIDDIIEKEYITGTIDKTKDFTGDVVQKVGNIYEKTKMKVEELREQETIPPIGEVIVEVKEKVVHLTDKLVDKIEEIKEDIYEEE